MKTTLSKGEGTNFYINDTSITRGSIVIDWFPATESVRFRVLGEQKKQINIIPYTQFINGLTGLPFVSFADFKSWVSSNVNAIDTPETSDGGSTPASNVKVSNLESESVPVSMFNVPHVMVDNSQPINVSVSNPQESVEVTNTISSIIENVVNVIVEQLPSISIAPNQALAISGIIHSVIDSMPDVKVTSMPAITLAANQTVLIGSIIHAIIDSLPPVNIAPGETIKVNNIDPLSVSISNAVHAAIDSMPAVTLAAGQMIGINNVIHSVIDSMPNVNLTAGQTMGISNVIHAIIDSLPAISLAAGQQVAVSSITGVIHAIIDTLPSITFAAGSEVKINNTTAVPVSIAAQLHAIIDSLPAISLAAGSSLSVNNTLANPVPTLDINRSSVISKTVSAATTNAKLIKTGKSFIYMLYVTNTSSLSAIRYLKIYDKATIPVVGTDVPILTFPIPNGLATPLMITVPEGIPFVNGIGIGITGALADLDVTAIVAADVIVTMVAG